MADRTLNLGTLFTANIADFLAKARMIKAELMSMGAAFERGAKGGAAMGTATAAGMGKVDKSVKKSSKGMQEYSKQIGKVEGAWKRTLAAMKVTASYGLAATGIFSVIQALKAGVVEIGEFDQALKNLQAITRATDNEVIGMGETIKDVAEKTKFSTGEVAEGMVLLGQAGFSATEAMQAMQAVANLATGTLTDLKTTSDLLTTAIRAFGFETIESARVSDVMANAINRSKLTLDKLRTAFNFVGAAASQTGLSLEETAASMMVLANHGLRASTIGTGLRQVLARLLAPNRRLREEFEAHGIELSKVNPRLVGFQTAMNNLKPILFDAKKGVVDMGKAYRLFGLRGAQAAAILTKAFAGTGAGSFQDMLDKTYEIGSASEMAAKQMEGIVVQLKNLADRAKLIAVAFGEGGAIGVMKLFINTLRALAKAIADFVSSGIGRISTSFIVWTGTIWLSIYAIKGLGIAFIFLGSKIKAVIITLKLWIELMYRLQIVSGLSLLSMKGLRLAMANLMGIISKFKGGWLLLAAAIGVVVAAIKFWIGAQDRAVKAAVKVQQKQEQITQTLKVYRDALGELHKEYRAGKDVQREHAALVKRLRTEYEGLNTVLRESVEFAGSNAVLAHRAYQEELKRSIIANADLTKALEEQIKQTQRWAGIMKELKTIGGIIVGVIADMFAFFGKIVRGVANLAVKALDRIEAALKRIHPALGFFLEIGKRGLKAVVDFLDAFADRAERAGSESEKAAKQIDTQTQSFIKMAKALKELIEEKGGKAGLEEIVEQIEKMTGLEVRPEQMQAIRDVIEATTVEIEKGVEDWENALGKLPKSFQDMFEKLDPMRKADFAKMIDSMEQEVAAVGDKVKFITKKEEEQYAIKSAIRAKWLAKFQESLGKETQSVEENLVSQIRIAEEFQRKIEEQKEVNLAEREEMFQKELLLATGNEEELTRVKQENLEKREQIEKVTSERILGWQAVINAKRIELEQELAKQMRKEHETLTKEAISELKKRYKELDKEAKKYRKTSEDFEKKGLEVSKEIRQKGMSDEQQWRDTRLERDRILTRARATNDEEYYEKAIELTGDLGRVVVDENGKTVKSLEENSRRYAEQARRIAEEAATVFRNMAIENEKESEKIQEDIETLVDTLKLYKTELEDASRKELKLNAQQAIDSMRQTYEWTRDFKELWDNIESKSITLNIQTAGGTGGGGTVESREDKDLEDYFEDIDAMKKGGVVKGKIKQVKEVIHRRVGGWATKAVGKIRGYGGGDIVKAMLEPGEYVARKEAVKRYGAEFFEGLNKMTVPQTVVEAAGAPVAAPAAAATGDGGDGGGVAAKIGGLIKEIKKKAITSVTNNRIVKLRRGGSISHSIRNIGSKINNSLSNISYSSYSRLATVAARSGGLVMAATPAPVVVKMEGGGQVPLTGRGPGREINITFAPKYMTGDRRSMRQAAVEIKRELEALGIRWGK